MTWTLRGTTSGLRYSLCVGLRLTLTLHGLTRLRRACNKHTPPNKLRKHTIVNLNDLTGKTQT
ncbi:hypothetical protein QP297_26510, partial [Escherichia coli]|nr:hypothetical protein [Escherichia coli]